MKKRIVTFRSVGEMRRFAKVSAVVAHGHLQVARSRTIRILVEGYIRMKKEEARR